jgi:hypothetical protein
VEEPGQEERVEHDRSGRFAVGYVNRIIFIVNKAKGFRIRLRRQKREHESVGDNIHLRGRGNNRGSIDRDRGLDGIEIEVVQEVKPPYKLCGCGRDGVVTAAIQRSNTDMVRGKKGFVHKKEEKANRRNEKKTE